MAEDEALFSEAEELGSFLAELESEREVKEIAGWETGFPGLSRALNGLLPGLYLLIGPPSSGKSAFAKQLCDQAAQSNQVAAIFYAFAETKKELRIRTLARLSGLENREIRRGSSFLLHWYGEPKRRGPDPERMAPSWEKLKRAAEEARSWLGRVYLFEGADNTSAAGIEKQIRAVREIKGCERVMAVLDDCQRLGPRDLPIDDRLPIVAEELQGMAARLKFPLFATWPDLRRDRSAQAFTDWAERVGAADVILVMENDPERTKKLSEPARALNVHVVKNRGGERGALAFEFMPPFAKFTEVPPGLSR